MAVRMCALELAYKYEVSQTEKKIDTSRRMGLPAPSLISVKSDLMTEVLRI